MIFKKLDDNTVRCILSQEDMEERGLKVEDFFADKDKTRLFLEDIVKLAQEEVGYEISSEMLAMQVMPLPHNGLAITFSDKSDHNIQDMIGQIKSLLEDTHGGVLQSLEDDDIVFDGVLKEAEEIDEKKTKPKKGFTRVFRFNSLDLVEQFCMTLPEEVNIKSQLYKDETEGKYYLVILKGRLSVKRLEAFCLIAPEYGTLVSKKDIFAKHCEEHFRCMIVKNAVRVLQRLAV